MGTSETEVRRKAVDARQSSEGAPFRAIQKKEKANRIGERGNGICKEANGGVGIEIPEVIFTACRYYGGGGSMDVGMRLNGFRGEPAAGE